MREDTHRSTRTRTITWYTWYRTVSTWVASKPSFSHSQRLILIPPQSCFTGAIVRAADSSPEKQKAHMDARERMRFARSSTNVYSTWHNDNIRSPLRPSTVADMGNRLPAHAGGTPLIRFSSPLLANEGANFESSMLPGSWYWSGKATPSRSPSRPQQPGPGLYQPRLTSTGREHDMADLNGSELMKSASFSNTSPARALPQHWGTIFEACSVAQI